MAALPAPHRPAAEQAGRRILVDPDRWMARPPSDDAPVADLGTLHTAVFADLRLRIRYRHSGGTRLRTYTVDPYGLVMKAGTWYLVADRRGRPQLFRADRVASAAVTDVPVRRRAGVELAEVWQLLRRDVERRPDGVRVRARIHRDRLDLALRILGPALTGPPVTADEPPAAGWTTVELAYPVLRAVRQLLQFGDSLEVLDPPEARRVLADAAADVSALYAADGTGRGPAG